MGLFGSDDVMDELEEKEEAKVREVLGEQLGNLLIEHGYGSLDAIREASDDELEDIPGIGTFTLRERIRKPLAEVELGVSEEFATTPSEVKPESTDAEAAEEEDAETASAEEARAEMAPEGPTTAVRSLWPQVIGLTAPSGASYQWPNAGAQVNVAAEDVEFVMGKNRNAGRACCGGSSGHQYFELA
jgi:hypothetical protein